MRPRLLRRLLFFTLAAILTPIATQGAIRYVDASATGNGSGISWRDAFPELVTAINAATAGDEIWIAQGIPTTIPSAARTPPTAPFVSI